MLRSPLSVALSAGSRLGPYELQFRLGVGGMGEVWRAHDSRLGRSVAIKVIRETLAGDEQIRARMQREARSVSALNHPNIAALFDIGHEENADFMVMELVEGETLADRIRSGPMTSAEIVSIGSQVADAVQEAHAAGITHRDLKPSNIMITNRGRVKVLDFGLAKNTDAHDEATMVRSATGLVVGTFAYMSPEQASGKAVDHRSDIYSLGVVLYEMATGAKPFEGKRVRELNPDIPARLERLIERCMIRAAEERTLTAAELVEELRHSTDPEPKARTPRPASKPRSRPAGSKARAESVAVLPFTNATGDPQLDYLSDGIAEGVLHQLSQSSTLRVLARSTSFRYRNHPDPVAAGKELKVQAVLTGEVNMRRGAATVSVELVDVKKGSHIWGRVFTDAEARTVDEQIAREAATALDAGSGVKASRAAIDEEAHRLYLRGRYALNKWTSDSLHSAIHSFQQSIERDPTFALGFAGLADAYLMFEPFTETATRGSLSKARAAAMRALQLDDTLAEAHTSLAMAEFNQWHWEAAEREFDRAIALTPNYEIAPYWYSMYLVTRGRMDDALRMAERATQIDPLSSPIAAHAAACLVMCGRAPEGIRELKRLADLEPNVPMIHQWLAFALFANGQYDRAVVEARKAVEVSNSGNLALATLGYYLCFVGGQEAAREILARLLEREDVRAFWIAGIYAGLKETDNALTWLEKGVYGSEGGSNSTTYITWPPWFDDLKAEPRYQAMLKHMGLVEG